MTTATAAALLVETASGPHLVPLGTVALDPPELHLEGRPRNHTYVRRPLDAADPFAVFWADGDPAAPSRSALYVGDSTGRHWRLPYHMADEWAEPIRQDAPGGTGPAWDRPLATDVPRTLETGDAVDGYRGVWFTLGQYDGEYGDKYAGGLGTYTMKHVPTAVHAPAAGTTFFTYGGARGGDAEEPRQDLLVMAGAYDHDDHLVRTPRVVDPKPGVSDPHDDGSIALDAAGHVWVFVSGRGRSRPGRVYRSESPHDVTAFEQVREAEFTYPQPWYGEGAGFCHLFTKYTDGRELYWATSDERGRRWGPDRKLAGFGGHYQTSVAGDDDIVTAFNWHPEGDVDRRTNLYVLRTRDRGATWRTVDGAPVETPLADPANPALVRDYGARDRLVYLNDLTLDGDGNPVVTYVTSDDHEPGPGGDPRRWLVAHWTGDAWTVYEVTRTDHNYDSGSLWVEGDRWVLAGPTEPGGRPYHTGGDVALWASADAGAHWERTCQVTSAGDSRTLSLVAPGVSPVRVVTPAGVWGVDLES